MSTWSAAPAWNPSRPAHAEVRLTRRGRLARAAALTVVAGLLAASLIDTFDTRPALADDSAPATPVTTRAVVVDSGDSLWSIATTVAPQVDPRETIHEIRELNGLTSSLLHPGQVVLIPTTLGSV